MGNQLLLERYQWFDRQIRAQKYPNARKLAEKFEFARARGECCNPGGCGNAQVRFNHHETSSTTSFVQ
jgi:hypothetical protein